jgi:hypothetical protein
MRRSTFVIVGAAFTVLLGSAAAGGDRLPIVSVFYYPWFSTAAADGTFGHWAQAGHVPPDDIASVYYPVGGIYSSGDRKVLATQMAEIQAAGINQIAVSWWGQGSAENERLPAVVQAANRSGVDVAVQIEPYPSRTVESTLADITYLHGLGIHTVYVYEAFRDLPPTSWAWANDGLHRLGITTFAQTGLVGQAVAGHFSGVYTYDIVTWPGAEFSRLCGEAHAHGLICAPSVGPGYDARRASGDPRVRPRFDGTTYDSMWNAALAADADEITITSFNEWEEGTQIEPAAPPSRRGEYRYGSYDRAWGLSGVAAEFAYLDRTAYWACLFDASWQSRRGPGHGPARLVKADDARCAEATSNPIAGARSATRPRPT